MLDGQTDAALAQAETVVEQLRSQGGVGAQAPLVHRIRGAAHLQRGDLERSRSALEASLSAGRSRQTDYEVALTLEVLAEAAARAGDGQAQAFRDESSAILERLEVISTPDIVAGDAGVRTSGHDDDVRVGDRPVRRGASRRQHADCRRTSSSLGYRNLGSPAGRLSVSTTSPAFVFVMDFTHGGRFDTAVQSGSSPSVTPPFPARSVNDVGDW